MTEEITVGSTVEHDRYGKGKVINVTDTIYEIEFDRIGSMEILHSSEDLNFVSAPATETDNGNDSFELSDLEVALSNLLDINGFSPEVVPLGERWKGGTISIQPADASQKPKEIPVETFFHKIIMVRDRLRVLEQNINSHDKLNDEEKVHLQQYITRAYGSLTTFNILFANKDHQFKGSGS